jgi:MFS transporter, Spinster family, sphingosine-1-phosphate transporter
MMETPAVFDLPGSHGGESRERKLSAFRLGRALCLFPRYIRVILRGQEFLTGPSTILDKNCEDLAKETYSDMGPRCWREGVQFLGDSLSTMMAPRDGKNNQSWGPVVWLALAFTMNYADRQFLFAAFPQVRLDLSLSNTQLGLAGSFFTWTYAAAMPLAGYMADRLPRHRLVISALLLWSLATLGTSLSQNLWQLLFWRVMMGVTEALYVPAAFGILATIYPGKTRSRAFSILDLAQFLGLTVGGIYGGWSTQEIGWRRGSQTLAAIGLVYALVLIGGFWRFDSGRPAPHGEPLSAFRALRSLPYLLLAVTFSIFCGMLWLLYVWLPTAVHETYKLSLTESGIASTLYLQIGSAVGVLMGGVLGDWAGRRSNTSRLDVALWGVLCCSPFALVIFATHSLTLLRIATLCFGLSSGLFIANVFSCLYDFTDRNNFSFAIGCLNMLGGSGAGVAILLAGIFKNTWGIATLMLWSSLLADTTAIIFLLAARRRANQGRGLSPQAASSI